MRRTILAGGVVAFASLGVGALYLVSNAPPACGSEPALRKVTEVLRDRYHLDSIFVNDITTESGGMFADQRVCSAEVATIRGNVNAADMKWREVRYRIGQPDTSAAPVIAVTLGDDVPLAKPALSWWGRLLANL